MNTVKEQLKYLSDWSKKHSVDYCGIVLAINTILAIYLLFGIVMYNYFMYFIK